MHRAPAPATHTLGTFERCDWEVGAGGIGILQRGKAWEGTGQEAPEVPGLGLCLEEAANLATGKIHPILQNKTCHGFWWERL